jgi:hypothetical protein
LSLKPLEVWVKALAVGALVPTLAPAVLETDVTELALLKGSVGPEHIPPATLHCVASWDNL